MDILVTGGSGQIGIELLRQSWPEGFRIHAPSRAELDLADPASIERVMSARPWAGVISSGAYTAVDKAETDVTAAWTVNALAPAILARRAAEAGVPIIHVSTDYVFDGSKQGYYVDDDPVAPINVYGASKEGGEQAVRTANPRHVIVRTAWVVSPHRSNFVRTMLRLATEREELRVVADQQGCPTFAPDLADAIVTIAGAVFTDPNAQNGTVQVVNEGEANWAGFAEAIFAASARRGGPSARVVGIATADYPTPARRPANSRLATAKARRLFGISPRPWQTALEETLAKMI